MSNRLIVHVMQCFDDIFQKEHSHMNIHVRHFVEVIKESASVHILHYQVDCILVLENTVEFDDV